MADETGAAGAAKETKQENKQVFRVQKVYIKDVSFETPRSTEIFTCLLYTSPSPRDRG